MNKKAQKRGEMMIKSWIKDMPGDLFAIVLGLGAAYAISLFF